MVSVEYTNRFLGKVCQHRLKYRFRLASGKGTLLAAPQSVCCWIRYCHLHNQTLGSWHHVHCILRQDLYFIFKGKVHPKILSSFTHPHLVLNDFLFFCRTQKKNVSTVFVYTMKVSGVQNNTDWAPLTFIVLYGQKH